MGEPALRALVNWGIAAGDLLLLQSALVAARKNGAVKSYAAPSAKLAAKPSGAAAQSLAPVPADTRGAEVALGGGFVAAGGLLLSLCYGVGLVAVQDSSDCLRCGEDFEVVWLLPTAPNVGKEMALFHALEAEGSGNYKPFKRQ